MPTNSNHTSASAPTPAAPTPTADELAEALAELRREQAAYRLYLEHPQTTEHRDRYAAAFAAARQQPTETADEYSARRVLEDAERERREQSLSPRGLAARAAARRILEREVWLAIDESALDNAMRLERLLAILTPAERAALTRADRLALDALDREDALIAVRDSQPAVFRLSRVWP